MSGSWRLVSSMTLVDVRQLNVGLLHDSGWCPAVKSWSLPWLWLISGSWRLVSSMTLVDVQQLKVGLLHDPGWCPAVEGWSPPWLWLMSSSWRLVSSMTLVDVQQLKVGLLHDWSCSAPNGQSWQRSSKFFATWRLSCPALSHHWGGSGTVAQWPPQGCHCRLVTGQGPSCCSGNTCTNERHPNKLSKYWNVLTLLSF